jgi:hypothetical protein
LSLVMGGNPGPQLAQLAAQAARPQLAPTSQAGWNGARIDSAETGEAEEPPQGSP